MRISRSSKSSPVLVTMGDPSGIGPEVLAKALCSIRKTHPLKSILVLGDSYILTKTVRNLGLKLDICRLNLLDFSNVFAKSFAYGVEDPVYGQASFKYIKEAVRMLAGGRGRALVTAPVSKSAIARSGVRFQGHTEYLAEATKTRRFAMMLIGGRLKVTLVTRHIPLKDIPRRLTAEAICDAVELTRDALIEKFRIRSPRIGVAGLNPHAGEGGLIGGEEKSLIMPALRRCQRKGGSVIIGPRPPDAIFHEAYNGRYDAVVVMYHDQGLIPLKMLYFESGVNLTLGLPFVRTSPDHGTAFDIAGKGVADERSMVEAIRLAFSLTE